jgi:L-iditol 2-dehydrogenase
MASKGELKYMKAARFIDNSLVLVEEPVPNIKPSEVLLKVEASSICGSDQKILEGKKKALPNTILGHETAGVVAALGEGVSGISQGGRVTVFPSITCGECLYCRTGKSNICIRKRTIGYALDGGFAEYLLIPAEMVKRGCLVTLPPHISFEEGSLMEPLSCCISSLTHTGMNRESRLLIIGGGPMGQLHVLAARALGASKILLSEPHEKRREHALNLGADKVLNPQEERIEDIVLGVTQGTGVDICILCMGDTSALESAIGAVRKRGVISFFASFAPYTQSTIDPNKIHYSELTLTGTHSTTLTQFKETVVLSEQYGIDLKKVITHRFPIEQIGDAFETYRKQEGLKIMLKPGKNSYFNGSETNL